jgi:hypothetical protein
MAFLLGRSKEIFFQGQRADKPRMISLILGLDFRLALQMMKRVTPVSP